MLLPENCFVLSKKYVTSLQHSEFYGYGFTDDAVIIGTDGLREYLQKSNSAEFPREGRFCGVFIDGQDVVIRADATGQECLYLFRNGSDWIVSNSFMLLAEQAAKSAKLSIYVPSVMGFNLKNGVHIGEQLISHRTMISEIELVPITSELRIKRETGVLSVHKSDYLSMFTMKSSEDYEEKFLEVLERGAGILGAMLDRGVSMNLFLSGGYDSRLVLCMLMASQRMEELRVTSLPEKQDDFRVATSLCNRLDLKLNTKNPPRRSSLSGSDAVRMYMISSGGTYLPFYPVQNFRLSSDFELRLTGDQPTGWSHFAGRARFNGNAKKIANDISLALQEREMGEVVKEEFLSTFDLLEIDNEHPAAMLAHYSAIRARHHCGRNWYKSQGAQFLFTPLMQSDFVALDLHNSSEGYHPTKFFADAFSAFGDWALSEPFETPDRAFNSDLLANSPFKGGVNITPRKYDLYGTIGKNTRFDEPGIYSIPMEMDTKVDSIKDVLTTMFYRAHNARESGLFVAEDFAKVNGEIHANGSLSHSYRKLCHIVSVDIVLKIIQNSGTSSSEIKS